MKNILVIEDSKTMNNIITKELSSLGFEISQAFTLKDAQNFLSNNKYSLIILDLHLPDGEGSELIANIQCLTKTKVVVLTSTQDDELRDELFAYGILDYIIKDKNLLYSISEIVKIIQTVIVKEKDKILIIDDSNFICKQVKTVLEPRNYVVQKANSAKKGLELLGKESFDLLILDMELPDMHGIKVLEKIRKQSMFINLPIVVLSGTSTPEIVRNCLKNGASDFLKKPFIFEEFILKIDLWIDYYKQKKQNKEKTKELEYINTHLKELVEEEVKKNKEKDKLMIIKSRQIQMGEMIAMIAHQWRQPLNAIAMAVNLIDIQIHTKNLNEKIILDITSKIHNYIQHLSKTIDDFRDFFKPKKDMQKSNFKKIIKKALNLIEYDVKKSGIKINLKVENVKNIFVYENEMLQVVLNILKNAQDVLKAKGVSPALINIKVDSNTLSIEDNGGGIDNEIISKIFEPYFSTKEKDGTGLGLYMSKLIVEEHLQGELLVKNTKQGACFKIVLKDSVNEK